MWKRRGTRSGIRSGGMSRSRPGASSRGGEPGRFGTQGPGRITSSRLSGRGPGWGGRLRKLISRSARSPVKSPASRGLGSGSRAGRSSAVARGLGGGGGAGESNGDAPRGDAKIAGMEPTVFYGLLGAGALVVLVAVILFATSGPSGSSRRRPRYASGSSSRPSSSSSSSTWKPPNFGTLPNHPAQTEEEAREYWAKMHLGEGHR